MGRHAPDAQGSKDGVGYAATDPKVDSSCQYELTRQHPDETHLTLYRGTNGIDEHEVLERGGDGRYRVLLNNLNSFTSARERADEFGDYILETPVPMPKIVIYNSLLPSMLKGEDEVVVIGGVYEVTIGSL